MYLLQCQLPIDLKADYTWLMVHCNGLEHSEAGVGERGLQWREVGGEMVKKMKKMSNTTLSCSIFGRHRAHPSLFSTTHILLCPVGCLLSSAPRPALKKIL